MPVLIDPHGGLLKNMMVVEKRALELKQRSFDLPEIYLDRRRMCDLELLLNGGYSPLSGYLSKDEYNSVLDNSRLTDGTLWPIPVMLDISSETAEKLSLGGKIGLYDEEGLLHAVLTVKDIWKAEKEKEAMAVYGIVNEGHPGVFSLYHDKKEFYVGGEIEGIVPPLHYDFKLYRHPPAELRKVFSKLSWNRVIAFHTSKPVHKAQFEMTLRTAREFSAKLLISPAVGGTQYGDIDYYSRIRSCISVSKRYPNDMMMLSLLPYSARYAGPKEAVLHAIIKKNYGCSHFIAGPDHASPMRSSSDDRYYGQNEAQDFLKSFESELEISIIPVDEYVFVPKRKKYLPLKELKDKNSYQTLSGNEVKEQLINGEEIPEWYTFPEALAELKKACLPKTKRGFTIFMSGLSGAGKSTLAKALLERLLEMNKRPVTLLDGDIVRKNLSSELTFSKEHRDLNIKRIGFVASEITKNGGIAICAPIAPYENIRQINRKLISNVGGYIEVHVSTPVETCEKRDRKGLYEKARAGLIKNFTGISDPYEEPMNPEIRIDTTDITTDEAVQKILYYLDHRGYIDLYDNK